MNTMAMPIKPQHLKKIPISVGITPATIEAIDQALDEGQSRSAWIADAIAKALKDQGIKIQKKLRN